MNGRPPRSTLFPYTTLSRSGPAEVRLRISDRRVVVAKLRHSHHVAADELVPVLAALDKWERAPADSERLLTDALRARSEEHTSELQSQSNLVCRLLLEKKKH